MLRSKIQEKKNSCLCTGKVEHYTMWKGGFSNFLLSLVATNPHHVTNADPIEETEYKKKVKIYYYRIAMSILFM